MRSIAQLSLVVCLSIAFATRLFAQQTPDDDSDRSLRRLSIEELGRLDVTSASRHAEPLDEAAAAITVITGDDIRRSGATTLADALRLAVGVHVARINGQSWAISARGFNSAAANKMVVLIDGRSVYTPLFSGVFWDQQNVVLDDVDRIEIIRGAGSTLWGANAVNGVINVITRRATDTAGGLVHVDGGNAIGQASFRYGAPAGSNAAYRAYGTFRYLAAQEFTATGADAQDTITSGQGGFRYDADPSSRTAFALQGDIYRGAEGLADRDDISVSGGNVLGRLSHTTSAGAQWQVQFYYDTTHRDVPLQYEEHRHTGNVDTQYRVARGAHHDLTVGAGLDVSRSDTVPTTAFSFTPDPRTAPLLNVFAQDVIAIVPHRFDVIVGSKFEHNVYTGFEFQPTARVRWRPRSDQTVWGSISRAVRMPSRFDTDLRFMANTGALVLSGSADFQSETVIAYEAGYRRPITAKVSIDVAAFVNDYDRLRTEEPTPPAGFPIVLANNMTGHTGGVEITADVQALPFWQIHVGYSALAERIGLTSASHDPTSGFNEFNDPPQQFLLRSLMTLPRHIEADAVLRSIAALPHPAVDQYTEVTVHIGWRPTTRVELAFVGDNLLHSEHQEFRIGAPPESIRRQLLTQFIWRF